MQSAHPTDRFDARSQVKMIGIAQQDLHTQFFEYVLRHALDGRERPYRHEHRGLDHAVRDGKTPDTSRAVRRLNLKLDGHRERF